MPYHCPRCRQDCPTEINDGMYECQNCHCIYREDGSVLREPPEEEEK